MKHKWTEAEDIAVLALTKKYGLTGWKHDSLATALISGRGIGEASLQMALGNFVALMGIAGGLENWSKRQQRSFQKYGKLTVEELYALAHKELGRP